MAFAFVSGNLALDFAGTLKWRRAFPEELLATPDDLARWAVEAGVLTEPPALGAEDLDRLKILREAVYRLVTDPRPDDRHLVNDYAAGPPPAVRIDADRVVRTGDADSVGWAIAWAMAELLSDPPGDRMRECERTACTRIFIDRSRTANRRWCGMEECGNRIKAATYRARKGA
ncbi:ABATE domain-containing protein [Kibdelosporangium aridum]|uniref:CGNR zinc finger domain-containing protein n=1 Tax=Kibdelosporangium aridum TaxID=2030 RepID=UPI00055BE14E|nr:ABATE domain-containing protein [Kibdelosporangium aridum]